jgi:hypothetical protein
VKKKPIKILKKLTSLIRFRFYNLETEKIKPNLNKKKLEKKLSQYQAKPSQTSLNQFLFKKRTKTSRFNRF